MASCLRVGKVWGGWACGSHIGADRALRWVPAFAGMTVGDGDDGGVGITVEGWRCHWRRFLPSWAAGSGVIGGHGGGSPALVAPRGLAG